MVRAPQYSGLTFVTFVQDTHDRRHLESERVWVLSGFHVNSIQLNSAKDTLGDNIPLPTGYPCCGRGAAVDDGVLYYASGSQSIVLTAFHLEEKRVIAQTAFPSACSSNLGCWNATLVQFCIDQTGLYVLYATTKDTTGPTLTASLVSRETLEVIRTWDTSHKVELVECGFVAEGVVYAINTFSEYERCLAFRFDLQSGKGEDVMNEFPHHGFYLCGLYYNHRGHYLYAMNSKSFIKFILATSSDDKNGSMF